MFVIAYCVTVQMLWEYDLIHPMDYFYYKHQVFLQDADRLSTRCISLEAILLRYFKYVGDKNFQYCCHKLKVLSYLCK